MSNDMKIAVEKINAEFEEARIQRQEAKRWHTLLSEGVDKNEGWADKRPWVGLTDEDREECLAKWAELGWWGVVDVIEAKLREKNGG